MWILTSTIDLISCPSGHFSHTSRAQQSRCQRSFVLFRWHVWGIKEKNFRIDESQSKEFLYQQFAAIQRKSGVSNPTASGPANNSAPSELDDDDQHEAVRRKINTMESGPEERKMGVKERWKWCHQDVCPPFHQQLHKNTLCSSTQLININNLYSFRYSWQNDPHKILHSTWCRSKNQETANWIPRSSSSMQTTKHWKQ